MTERHRLLRRQIENARGPDGQVDVRALAIEVSSAYCEQDRDRRRVDRANTLMAAEIADMQAAQERLLEELSTQNARFAAALDNMTQGLCLFDATGALVVCNHRLKQIYGLPASVTTTGRRLFDLLAQGAAFSPLRPQTIELIGECETLARSSRRAVLDQALPDGRTIQIAHEPLADGGFVQTFADITADRAAAARFAHMARHDALTDLPNRTVLKERLGDAVRAATEKNPCSVLMLDLDKFKPVNDTLGHPIGDALLIAVAQRLRRCVHPRDAVGRLGGDEFAIIQVGGKQSAGALRLARRLIATIREPYEIDGHKIVIGVSIGLATTTAPLARPESLLKQADLALYAAKSDGRGRARLFDVEMDAAVSRRRDLERDLRRAVANNDFELRYRPVICLATHEIRAFKALVRWRRADGGLTPTDVFLALATETGLIRPIGDWALREACREASGWPAQVGIAVNLWPAQYDGERLVAFVASALRDSGLEASRLELEVSESQMLQHSDASLKILQRLKSLGVRIAMGQFGIGYSASSCVRSFPFDRIKIDEGFVTELGNGAEGLSAIRAVAGLCHGVGIPAAVEGVAAEERLRALSDGRCADVEGFQLGEPLLADDVSAILSSLDHAA